MTESAQTCQSLTYADFLESKSQLGANDGFEPSFMPDYLFDFQKALVEWKIKKGRGALFEDCGLGKTIQELVIAENTVRHTNRNVLILTPLAVSYQFLNEGEKFGIEVKRSVDGKPAGKITVTNYEKLHLFDPDDFEEIICDESSILKHFGGSTQKHVTRFTLKKRYRTLATATAAPNDFYELGTSAEAVGALGYSDMLSRFFNQSDNKSYRMNEVKLLREAKKPGKHFAKLAYRAAQQIGQWKLKPHAEIPFWKWVCSWARACRMPSDLGFPDNGFILPDMIQLDHVVIQKTPPEGMLFTPEVFGLNQEREERRRTMEERCGLVAELAKTGDFVFIGCHLNTEGDMIEKMIPGAVQVAGKNSDEEKEERLMAFSRGEIRVLVSKAKIAAWGLNYQHCNHVITFASHSYEQHYQFIRRCLRFGQKRPVTVDVISTEGEQAVRDNMKRKSDAAGKMFVELVKYMNEATWLERSKYETKVRIPEWLLKSKR
jgi:superfamily II DNA or RNA helicase